VTAPKRKLDQTKVYRRRKIAEGYCARGKSHGPAAPGGTRCFACIDSDAKKRRARYLREKPHARINRCSACNREGHIARRCPELARREERGAA
jgi:hypothetical protein